VSSVALFPGGPVDSYAISDPVTQRLPSGIYYWTAAYSDGSQPQPTTSPCGSETLTIGSPPRIVTRSAFISVRSVTLPISCTVLPCRLTVTLTLPPVLGASDARATGKRNHLGITLARGTATIRKHGAQTVRLRVTPAGRRFVSSHRGRATVIAAIAMRLGGHTTITKQRFKIKIAKTGKPRNG
jgi:hypothetical protein